MVASFFIITYAFLEVQTLWVEALDEAEVEALDEVEVMVLDEVEVGVLLHMYL